MQNRIFLLLALLLIAGIVSGSNLSDLKHSRYEIGLRIIPAEQFIKVSGSLKYIFTQDSLENISFNLHRNLAIKSFTIDGESSYEIDTSKSKTRWLPDAIKIVHVPDRKYSKGEILIIAFSYEGALKEWPEWSANVITPDWVEIGLYFPWYPSTYGLFTYNLSVDIDPGYNVFARGDL